VIRFIEWAPGSSAFFLIVLCLVMCDLNSTVCATAS